MKHIKSRKTEKLKLEKSFEEKCPHGGIINENMTFSKLACLYCEGCEFDWLPLKIQKDLESKGVLTSIM